MATIRQQIISLLSETEMDARDLSKDLQIMEKEVYDHLKHIEQTVKIQNRKLVIHPSHCKSCGYTFKNRSRFSRPGKCPRCKKTFIQSPSFSII